MNYQATAVILTALDVEYMAVRVHLSNIKKERKSGSRYEVGDFCGKLRWRVVLTEVAPGNQSAAAEAERVLGKYSPDVALFVGVAGGIKDVGLGDVVACTKIYGYGSGKDDRTFKPRADVGESTYALETLAKEIRRESGWQHRMQEPSASKAFVGAMAAGEKVVSSTRSATFKFLRKQYSDALAVEMEGRGFLRALRMNQPTLGIVVRGISDLIDGKTDADGSGSQVSASDAGAAFAFELLANIDDEDLGQHGPSGDSACNLAYGQNPVFSGRSTHFAAVRQAFDRGVVAILHGLGGVGKTQIAAEFANREKDRYNVVWWLAGPDVEFQLLDLADALGAEWATDGGEKLDFLREWLRANQGWLIVAEDIPAPESLPSVFRQPLSGDLLVTSRNPNWQRIGHPIEVEAFSEDDAASFICRRLVCTPGDEEISALSSLLGFLPLALEQACAYIESTGLSVGSYCELFEKHRLRLLEQSGRVLEYPETVATTWLLNFDEVENSEPRGTILMRICSFFSGQPIPRELLNGPAATGALELEDDRLALLAAIRELRKYSLVSVSGDSLQFHRLVQEVTRDNIPPELVPLLLEASICVLEDAFPRGTESPSSWSYCGALEPHGEQAVEHLLRSSNPTPKACYCSVFLLNQMGCFAKFRGQYESAKHTFGKALALWGKAIEPPPDLTANLIHNFAGVLEALGDLDGSQDVLCKALRLLPLELKEERAMVHHSLARVETERGMLQSAEAHYLAALRLSPQNPVAMGSFSSFLHRAGHWQRASEMGRQALERLLRDHGAEHPLVIQAESNLAGILKDLGHIHEAYRLAKSAAEKFETIVGRDHPDFGRVQSSWAMAAIKWGRLEEAITILKESLELSEKHLGPNHPDLAPVLTNLGNAYSDIDVEVAESYLVKAFDLVEHHHSANLALRALVRNNLGMLYARTGKLERAEELLKEAEALEREAMGPGHPDRVKSLINLGSFLNRRQRTREADDILEEAVTLASAPNFPLALRATVLQSVAEQYADRKDWARATPLYREALALCDSSGLGGSGVVELREALEQAEKATPVGVKPLGPQDQTPRETRPGGLKHGNMAGDPPEKLLEMFGLPDQHSGLKVRFRNQPEGQSLQLFVLYQRKMIAQIHPSFQVRIVESVPDAAPRRLLLPLDVAKSRYPRFLDDWPPAMKGKDHTIRREIGIKREEAKS